MNPTNQPGPLRNKLKWFCWKIRFHSDIREISDSVQSNTAQSQKIKFAEIQNLLINTVQSHTNFVLLSNISIFRESRVHMLIFRNIFENLLKIQNWLTLPGVRLLAVLRGVSELNFFISKSDLHCAEFCRHEFCLWRPLLALKENITFLKKYMWTISA